MLESPTCLTICSDFVALPKFGVFGFPRQPSVARHWENVQGIILTQSTLSQWDIICVTHC